MATQMPRPIFNRILDQCNALRHWMGNVQAVYALRPGETIERARLSRAADSLHAECLHVGCGQVVEYDQATHKVTGKAYSDECAHPHDALTPQRRGLLDNTPK